MATNKKIILFLIWCVFFTTCSPTKNKEVHLIPSPQEIEIQEGTINATELVIETNTPELKPLQQILKTELNLVTKNYKKEHQDNPVKVLLSINPTLEKNAYEIFAEENITINGGSYQAVSEGTTTLLQLINDQNVLPKISIKDASRLGYRSLMIDCARGWHSIETLEQIIQLCRWYKINYLHLHLTDDQLFTFQSDHFPKLASEQSYSKKELIDLNKFAIERGVTLIPEIDVPGHASRFVQKMPELFGIDNPSQNSYTISIGKEEVYLALEKLFGELAEVFSYSPFIHIGGDEAFFEGMENDPTTIAYMEKNNISSVKELFRHFIIRMNESVKKTGKQMMVWAGFAPKGEIEIPRDIVVILWESQYYNPHQLIKDGFQVINASFKPLYVVNNRKWSTQYIFENWNERRWESWATSVDKYDGIEVETNASILGATMCSWEQSQLVEIFRLRKRLAAMSQNLWSLENPTFNIFENTLKKTDQKLNDLLYPFQVNIHNNKLTNSEESNFYEHLEFEKELKIEVISNSPILNINYEWGGKEVTPNSPRYSQPLVLDSTAYLKIHAFDQNGKKVGHTFYTRYIFAPITAIKNKLEKDLPKNAWEKMRFIDSMEIILQSPLEGGQIKYSLNSKSIDSSGIYQKPIKIFETTRIKAQFINKAGTPQGNSMNETYYLLKLNDCLTTNKKVTASNDATSPDAGRKATNGRVTLWEQWGDHNNGNNWIQVDLEKVEKISRFLVHNFWDNYRYYQYKIEGSLDGENWSTLVDFSKNEIKASIEGYEHKITPQKARYIKLNMMYNSANPGLHVVEFCAFNK